MFGYVRVFQPELKMKEWDRYRGIYCSLCRALGRRYGLFARFTLNYDLTALAAFHMALSPACGGFKEGRCPFRPTKKCRYCRDADALDFAADAGVLLTYYKIADDMADSGFFRRLWLRPLLWAAAPMKRKAARLNPALAEKAAAYAAAQRQAETDTPSVDRAAAPTAEFMAFLTAAGPAPKDMEEAEARARFGYCLGRWVYLIDGADDWEEDRKKGRFNPFPPDEEGNGPTHRMRAALNGTLAECLTAYHLLTRYHFDPILQNILQYGMPAAIRRVLTEGACPHDGSL